MMSLATKKSFTLMEVMISCILLGIVFFVQMMLYMGSFRAFNVGLDRASVRSPLAQTMALMSSDIQKASDITVCTENKITFTADLGDGGSKAYTYYLYKASDLGTTYPPYNLAAYNLLQGLASDAFGAGAIKATDVKPPTTDAPWFSCSNGVVTLNMAAIKNGETVQLRTSAQARNMPQGIVGWWKLNDASGTVAADSSSNSNVGTLVNTSAWTEGIGNRAVSLGFGGTNSYISVPSSTFLNVTGAITLAAWIKPVNGTTNQAIISKGGDSGRQYALELATTGPRLTFKYNVDQSVSTPLEPLLNIPNGVWTHVAVTSSSAGRAFYVNGASVYTDLTAVAITAGDDTLTIGKDSVASIPFAGAIDDVRIYNQALSADQINHLYAN